MDGVVDYIRWVQSFLEVGGHLLHGHAAGTLVQEHVRLVREGKEEEDSSKEHLHRDHEVVVGSRLPGIIEVDKGYPVKNGQQEACGGGRTVQQSS